MKDAAIAVILNQHQDQVLLVKRRDIPVWVLPGGGVDPGESPEQAVVREVLEETGLHVKIVRQLAEYSPINRWTSPVHLFLCQPLSGVLSEGAESAAVAYFPTVQLPPTLFCYHQEWLQEALDIQKLKGTCIRRPLSRSTFWRVLRTYFWQPGIALRYLYSRLRVLQ